jgi:hypothetical protein
VPRPRWPLPPATRRYALALSLGALLAGISSHELAELLAKHGLPIWSRAFVGSAVGGPFDVRDALQVGLLSCAPLVAAVYSVLASASLATDRESSATRALMRAAARLVAGATTVSLAIAVGLVLSAAIPGGLAARHTAVLAVPLALLPLMLACGGLGILVGVATGQRGATIWLVGAETVAVYALLVLADGVDALDALRYASPFHYADVRVAAFSGVEYGHVATLLAAFAVQILIAMTLLRLRNR